MAQEQVDSIIRALTNAQQLAAETNYRNGVIAQNQQELKAKQKKDEQDRADKIKQLEFENEQTKLASELAQQPDSRQQSDLYAGDFGGSRAWAVVSCLWRYLHRRRRRG